MIDDEMVQREDHRVLHESRNVTVCERAIGRPLCTLIKEAIGLLTHDISAIHYHTHRLWRSSVQDPGTRQDGEESG